MVGFLLPALGCGPAPAPPPGPSGPATSTDTGASGSTAADTSVDPGSGDSGAADTGGCPGAAIGACYATVSGWSALDGLQGEHLGEWLIAGDVDGDGIDELVVGVERSGQDLDCDLLQPSAYVATAPGVVASIEVCPKSNVRFGVAPALGDLDGDGSPELALAGSDRVTVFTGPFAGDLHPADALATLEHADQAAIGDVDADGFADLVYDEGVWFGPVVGTADAESLPDWTDGETYATVAVADLDHDGIDNVLHSYCCGDNISDVLGVLGGPLDRALDGPLGAGLSGGGHPVRAIGDLTGDGLVDVVIGKTGDHSDAPVLDNPVWVLADTDWVDVFPYAPSIDDEAWATFLPVTNQDLPWAAAIGDFDGDGWSDLAIGQGGRVAVHRGPIDPGDRLESEAAAVWVGPHGIDFYEDRDGTGFSTVDGFARALAAGDFDGDGRDDLAIGAPSADDVARDAGRVYLLWGAGL